MDLVHEVVRDLRHQPARLLRRLPVAGVRRARGQGLTVREDVPDEERRGHGALLRARRDLRVLQVRRQAVAAVAAAAAATWPLARLVHALPPRRRRRRRRRAAALRVRARRAELQRRAALAGQAAPLGHRAAGPVGQQRVDAETGPVGRRLHCLESRGLLKLPFGIQDKFVFQGGEEEEDVGVQVSVDPGEENEPSLPQRQKCFLE